MSHHCGSTERPVQAFTEHAPWETENALRLLRMAIKQQCPPHPGRIAEVRGLDQTVWQLALRCWQVGPQAQIGAPTMQEIVDTLAAPRDDILRCPFGWDTESLEAWTSRSAPCLDRYWQLRNVHKVKSGRDVEYRLYEIVGTRKGRQVNLISPHVCRRGSLRYTHVSLTVGALPSHPCVILQNFFPELLVWTQLRHPNILPVLGTYFKFWKAETQRCFVVPRMSGGTCIDYIREHADPDRMKIVRRYQKGDAPLISHRCPA